MADYNTIGFQSLTVGASVLKPTIPIGAVGGFIEVEGDVRYSISNQDIALTDTTGGGLLSSGTKIDLFDSDLHSLRLISSDATNKIVNITYLGT